MTEQRQVKKSKNTAGSAAECPVCMTGYDGTVQRPRILLCGHTVCTLCIDQLKVLGCFACPECCVSHAVPEVGQFPVNHAFETLIRQMKDAEVAAAAAALPPPSAGEGKGAAGAAGKKKGAHLFKKMKSILEEQEATVVAAITACREAQSQLGQYQTTLAGWRKRQQQLEDRLLGLVDQSRNARELLQQEESVAAKEEELKKGEQGMQGMLEMLNTPTTQQEVEEAVAKVLHCTDEAQQAVEKFRECFPNDSIIREVRETSSAALEAVQAVQAVLETLPYITTEEPRPQSDPDSTIMDRLHFIWTESLMAKDLRSLTQLARRLLEAGRVFAVHQAEGQRRHARISLEAGQLCLHALKDLPPPRGAAILQMSEVVPPSPPCTVFLDLSWPGSETQRVKIRLSP
ncbi:E3 ubiquitin-protein ligase TRIM32-like [Eriocheir sinensis]|uniref:E3 ubiquitin-protein ligase TRIM32-like n=1 Tax=Eriocheir sinensis TaxID=95602 RepID=UPI0021CA9E2A|nr:E3 ubiquitin-protein ligase TRIM32-like [Eriocheir sinensis]